MRALLLLLILSIGARASVHHHHSPSPSPTATPLATPTPIETKSYTVPVTYSPAVYTVNSTSDAQVTSFFGGALGLFAVFLIIAMYFLPAIIAARRGHHNAGAICCLTFFLGWTFLGWVIALVWSCTEVRKPAVA